jgi:undecaprenyl-diphosphatase
MSLDLRIFRELYDAGHSSWITALMVVLTLVGSGWGMFAFIPLMYRPHTKKFAIASVGLLTITAAAVFLLKLIVHRQRPWLALEGVRPLWDAPTDYSCPSGHAAGSFAFATFLAVIAFSSSQSRRFRIVGVLGIVLAIGIALSRVYLGVHFPFDVTAGALLGSSLGHAGARVYLKRFGQAVGQE